MSKPEMLIDEITEAWTDSMSASVATTRTFGRVVGKMPPSGGLPMFIAAEQMVELFKQSKSNESARAATEVQWKIVAMCYPTREIKEALNLGGIMNWFARRRARNCVLAESRSGAKIGRLPIGWRRDAHGHAYFEAGFRGDRIASRGEPDRGAKLWIVANDVIGFVPSSIDNPDLAEHTLDRANSGGAIFDPAQPLAGAHAVRDFDTQAPLAFTCEWPAIAFVRSRPF